MRTEETVPAENAPPISDNDLVQLAGCHAYLNLEEPKVLEVNGMEVEIIDSKYDAITGLDAFVVKKINNDEDDDLSIVFAGSQRVIEDRTITNTPFLRNLELAQMEEARAYFGYVERTFGSVSSVTGNSFGGALANAIAVKHSDVRSVTLNPAMPPDGISEKGIDYTNITNYYSKYDFLTSTQDTVGLGDRVPGNKYHINNRLPTIEMIGANHTGYVERIDDEYKVPIGVEGEAGYGFIHVGADDHIITSLWTGVPLYGGPATKLKINQNHMYTLAQGIEGKVIERVKLVDEYVGNANDIVVHEHEQFNRRVTELQEKFQDIFDGLAGDPMLMGISRTGSMTKAAMDQLIELLNVAEDKAHVLQIRIDSKPMELTEYITSMDISVETLFSSARNHLDDAKDNVNHFILSARSVVDSDIPDLFTGGKDAYADAVTGELKDHYAIVYSNVGRIITQLDNFSGQVENVASVLRGKDASISSSIKSKMRVGNETENTKRTPIISLESSSYLKRRMKMKKIQVNIAHKKINTAVTIRLRPVLVNIESVLSLLNTSLKTIISLINSASAVDLYGNPAEKLVHSFTDYEEKVKIAEREVIVPIEDMQLTIEALQKAFARLIVRFPEMVDDVKGYIDTAIFEPGGYSNIRLYNIACSSILDEIELLFKDITFQLSDEQAEEIQVSLKIAKSIKENIKMLSEQVERGTL